MLQHKVKSVSVIGLGYIGLPTAAMFASRKVEVIGVDINQEAVDIINQGRIHIVEPDLDIIVHAAVTEGYLRATTKAEPADAFLIAVPTPFKDNHEPDLAYVKAAAESIAPVLSKGNTVILESTSPVGATEAMIEWLAAARPDLRFPVPGANCDEIDIHVAYCPERVLPGRVVTELIENDRIIGGMTPACSQRAADIYRVFVQGQLLFSNARTAEMAKLTENAFRDVNIAFANELSLISDKIGIDVWELIRLANHHPRVNILQPGCGVGGHCIAVDPWFIVDKTPEQARLIRSAREVNDSKPEWVCERIRAEVAALVATGKPEQEIKVAVLGLAFKPDIDDLRESPALHIAEKIAAGSRAQLMLSEPNVEQLPASLAKFPLVAPSEAIANADVIAVLVKHRPFVELAQQLRDHSHVIDAVGILHTR
ncbi:UDP-N-acetyl-D-mannosamine dehydrogenase [Telluria mixta]|uniref:UDP-N-acetyl-D-mannosamine dehydrogenase n=1 Tax=Telluria mixta TaxID=34071 RepID=A0ABT2C0S1_9BURK|nr:UDP-N-acetyl-D-mannosamine dehydrogenase [Telluria mixta]MCS0630969.1 UDP-N-acetyl-D-mannosamine dehydrogenase [Telluria mixta]WEM98967.1 UDP-N-acetyl-D-mannosamine dehydrogenase [Telluria mixta]